MCPLEEVEAADLIRTVVRTVTGSNTAVVNHLVQTLMAVNRRCNWTNRLTRRLLTLHTWNWHEVRNRIVYILAFIIVVQANPVHFAATRDFLLTNDWNVILSLAGDRTRVTADTCCQVNRHRPLVVTNVRKFGIERCPVFLVYQATLGIPEVTTWIGRIRLAFTFMALMSIMRLIERTGHTMVQLFEDLTLLGDILIKGRNTNNIPVLGFYKFCLEKVVGLRENELIFLSD